MIVIAGDSWACGEWQNPEWGINYLGDNGLTRLLAESGRSVINIATPGASSDDIWLRLRDCFRQNRHLDITTAIVFQVELSRDPWFFRHNWRNGYRESKTIPIDSWYKKLSDLAVEYDVDILLIGGSGETWADERIKILYPRVQVACQSLTNLLINDKPNVDHPVLACWDESTELSVRIMKENSTDDEIKEMLDDIDRSHARLDLWRQNRQWFFPDGVHPNLAAHQRLYEYLILTFSL